MEKVNSNAAVVYPSGDESSLEMQRIAFSQRRFLATPLAGLIVWLLIAVSATFLRPQTVVWIMFIGTGSIVYLAIFLSVFTGENYLDRNKPRNEFDSLFLHVMASSLVIFAIAIPFFLVDYSSLPLTLGILTGVMWIPMSWIIQHRVGIYHCVGRSVLIVAAWYLFPTLRFVLIPLIIVLVYLITIIFLEARWRRMRKIVTPN